ncbi:MAG: T9SS type A sorting domain-containing protein, partial [Bacteroidota bacterium]|nr:T9SS type A sorting domain-containing protein [Candidatus Kapabacteria bacterium]MDW8220932.1 T9SS type A sorting domain-containing protein [Bacteroidota bacterium]
RFIPKTAGRKLASVVIRYRVGSSSTRVLSLTNIVQGDATPLKVVDTDFDLVRVQRRTVAAVLLINRLPRVTSSTATAAASQANVITITHVEIEGTDRASFTPVGFQAPVYLGAGDTTAIIVRCQPSLSGRLSARLKVYATVANAAVGRDSSAGSLRANAILAQPDDFFAEVALRPMRGQERGAPGTTVYLEVYYTRARLPDSANTSPQTLQLFQFMFGSMRFDGNVLMLLPNTTAEYQPNSASQNTIMRSVIFSSPRIYRSRDGRLPRRDSVLIDSIPCRIVAGERTVTPVLLEQLTWGRLGIRSLKVFVEEASTTHTVTAEASRSGGMPRLVAPTTPRLSIQAVRPNPALHDITVSIVLSDQQDIVMEIVDVQGCVIQSHRIGELAAGKHDIHMHIAGMSSGTYHVRVRSQYDTATDKIHVLR